MGGMMKMNTTRYTWELQDAVWGDFLRNTGEGFGWTEAEVWGMWTMGAI